MSQNEARPARRRRAARTNGASECEQANSTPQLAVEEPVVSDPLLPHHRKMLEESSGISPEVIEARGYRSLRSKAEVKRHGFSDSQCNTPTLLVPLWSVTGEVGLYHHRPDRPRILKGKPAKYEFPSGSNMIVDAHPMIREMLRDPKIPLFATEGAKKADAAISLGLCCIGFIGVWNFRGRNEHDGYTTLPDLDEIAWKGKDEHGNTYGRQVYIVYDSDVMLKVPVYQALVRLTGVLKQRGACVCLRSSENASFSVA